MKISEIAVRRGVTFGMIYLMIVGFGGFSLSQLQRDLYPDISFPTVVVITNYEGASPEDIETLITRPLEGAVASVKGVKEIESESKNGTSVVMANFEWDKDMEQAETDVRRQLEMVEGFLPEDADDSWVFAFDPSMQPIVMMMLSGPYPLDELRNIAADEIAPRIERLDGVATAEVAGGLTREIQIVLDPLEVEAYGLDATQVVGAVYAENMQEPGGSIEQGAVDFTIQTDGKYQTVEEIGEVLVGMKPTMDGMQPIRLAEVADVRDTFHEDRRVLEVDHEPTVWLIVRKQSGANTVKAAGSVLNSLPEIEREAAADLEFKILWDQSEFVNASLGNLSSTALIAIGISFLVLLLFLRSFVSSLIVALAIPISVVATFGVMNQADMTLNIISMAGLALAVGMLVDNAIVVLENIYRLREEGLGPWEAAIQGAGGVGTAVTASTLTTVSVFVPILFVPGIAGVMFQDMAVTICFALGVSLIVALTFIPLAGSRLLGEKHKEKLAERKKKWGPFRLLARAYGRSLDWTLEHRWVVIVAIVGIIGGAAVLAMLLPTEFVTDDDDSMIFVEVEAPVGTSLDETYAEVQEVVSIIETVVEPEERKLVGIDVGVADGFASLFSVGVHAATIRVPLVPIGERDRSKAEIEQELRESTSRIPGVKVKVGSPFNMMGGEGDMEILIRGNDLATSRELGMDIRDRLLARPDMAEVTYSMDDQKPEVRVAFDRPKLAQMGLSSNQAGAAISTYFKGRLAGRFAEGGDEYDILVRYPLEHRQDIEEIGRMPIVNSQGQSVPLQNVAHIDVGLGPVAIDRLDQERVTKVTAKLKDSWADEDGKVQRKNLGASIGEVTQLLEGYSWPRGFSWKVGGSAEDFMTSFRYLGVALMVSILLVFMVMASQFESLRQPFIIILSVPLGLVGVVLMFTLTRSTLDVSSMIGVIMLVGIAVNNGIVMLDAANQLRREGYGRREAIARAARIRMRPVLMTSITTILAMVPLALEIGEGAAGWAGMAKAVIGGLVVSTLLTLFVVPTMYSFIASKKLKGEQGLEPARTSGFDPGHRRTTID